MSDTVENQSAENESEGMAPKDETKEARFTRLANARMTKLLNDFRLISNLAGPNYKSTAAQRDKLVSRLRKAVEDLEYLFAGDADKSGTEFSLDDPISDENLDSETKSIKDRLKKIS